MDRSLEQSREDILLACLRAFEEHDDAHLRQLFRENPALNEQIRAAVYALEELSAPVRCEQLPASSISAGARVGDYVVLRQIGAGAAGIVFLAFDPKHNRSVALKILHPLHGKEMRERFERESKVLTTLRHRHIVSVLAVGQTDEGFPYFAMDYVEGSSLDLILTRLATQDPGHISAEDLFNLGSALSHTHVGSYVDYVSCLIADIAGALQSAHELGIVHRDIKPANILVDPRGVAHLVDFGIARVPATPRLTRSGHVPGTPEYMSPEQAFGRTEEVDRRSDIYSLGATFYHCLALRPPVAGSPLQILDHIAHNDPPSLDDLCPHVPLAVRNIVHKALEKDPNDRYRTASAFREDLLSSLASKPIRAQRPGFLSRLFRTLRWRRRFRGWRRRQDARLP